MPSKSRFRLCLALMPLLPHLCWSAINLADNGQANATSITTSVSCAVGDLMLVGTQDGSSGTPTVTGTVQGAYTFIKTVPGAGFDFLSEFYFVCTTTGTETITATGSGSVARIGFAHIAGFSHTATVVPGDSNQASTTSTALNSGSVSSSQANEYFFGLTDQTGITVTSPSFQHTTGNQNLSLWLGDPASTGSISPYPTVGTAVALTATMGSSNQWIAGIVGFYDLLPSTHTGAAYGVNHTTASQWVYKSASASLPVSGSGDFRFECDATSGAVTLTLPTAILNWNTYSLVKTDSSGNACTFATTSSQTINGSSTKGTSTQWATVKVTSDNANWVAN